MLEKPRLLAQIVTVAMVLGACIGCTPEVADEHYVSVTRSKIYASQQELVDDSPIIAVGVAGDQTVKRDLDPDLDFTLTSFAVKETIKGNPGSVLTIRQTGSLSQGAPGGILSTGQEYLLYLTPSGLPDDLGDQYYITGITAGLYEKASTSHTRTMAEDTVTPPTYVRADISTEDVLPEVIDAKGESAS